MQVTGSALHYWKTWRSDGTQISITEHGDPHTTETNWLKPSLKFARCRPLAVPRRKTGAYHSRCTPLLENLAKRRHPDVQATARTRNSTGTNPLPVGVHGVSDGHPKDSSLPPFPRIPRTPRKCTPGWCSRTSRWSPKGIRHTPFSARFQ